MRIGRKIIKNLATRISAESFERALAQTLMKSQFADIADTTFLDSTPIVAGQNARRDNVWDFCADHIGREKAVDYLEFGVFQGESIKHFATR